MEGDIHHKDEFPNNDINVLMDRQDAIHQGINIGFYAIMGHIVKVACIDQSLHPLRLAHFPITKPTIIHGFKNQAIQIKAIRY